MNEISPKAVRQESAASTPDEDALLQSALQDSDGLLTNSLREDDRRRRTRRLFVFTLIGGGIVMGTIVLALAAGWLTLFAPSNDGTGAKAGVKKPPLSEDARIAKGEELAQQGWTLWQQRKLDEAAKKFEESVALDANSANAWNGLGWARFNSGDGERAVTAFEKCVALEPNHPAGLNGLGQVYLSWREYDKAEKYLLKAAPKASAAWYGLARAYMLTGNYEKAQTWIKKALSEQPNDEVLKQCLAAAQRGELPAVLRKQIEPEGKPENSPATKLAVQGWQQMNQCKTRSATISFQRALAKDPENLSAMNGLGFLLLNTGKPAEAKALFEKYLEKQLDAPGPMNGLARCLKEEGKVDAAIALWEKMCKQNPGANAGTYGLATTYAERKEYGKAIPFYIELVKSDPNNEEFKKGLAEAQAASKAK
jgi:tetratricopeptide (TPR) repeat protein